MKISITKKQPQPESSLIAIKKRIVNTSVTPSIIRHSGLVMHSTIKTATATAKIARRTMSPPVNFAPFASCAVGTSTS